MKKRLARIWNHIETTDTEMADASDRIREHRERKEKLEIAAEEARALLKERRQFLDSADTIATFAAEMSEFLKTSELDRDQSLRRLLRQGGRGQARQGRHRLLHTHAGGFSHRGSGRRRDRPERASYEFGTSWWARAYCTEPDAPIDVKECCGIGLSSVGRRRPRERHSV